MSVQEAPQTCGASVAPLLERHGVQHVFGIPGNHTIELYRGLSATSIQHVTTRHEQGAAFMADGYARATGRPGVCFLISGPGLLNAATPIAQARADSIPMLVITAVRASTQLEAELGTLHELPDQRAAAAGFCSHSETLHEGAALADVIDELMTRLHTQRPGPVHLEIPLDVMMAAGPDISRMQRAPATAEAPHPDPETIARISERLATARNPALLIGGGCRRCAEQVVALAESYSAPVVNTVNAKGLVPQGHPLAVGGSPSLPAVRALLEASDLVVAVGTELGETDYDLLMTGSPSLGELVRIDIDPDRLQANHPAALSLAADAGAAITALLALAPTPDERLGTGLLRARQARTEVRNSPLRHRDFDAFFEALLEASDEVMVFGDSTRPTYYAAWQFEPAHPGSYHHSASGFGTLGYALPAAMGAAIGCPRPVVALAGDGGFQFTLNELATAREANLNLPVIVWCNTGYEEITNSLKGSGVDPASAAIGGPELSQLAAAYNCAHLRPANADELKAALRSTWQADRPTLIEVHQDDFVHTPSGDWY